MKSPDEVVGFENYTPELVYAINGMFGCGLIGSRVFLYDKTAIWVDAKHRLHRVGRPAVEHADGRSEYWLNGERVR
jgi:hypothetical protein